jgi:hypothetical protein
VINDSPLRSIASTSSSWVGIRSTLILMPRRRGRSCASCRTKGRAGGEARPLGLAWDARICPEVGTMVERREADEVAEVVGHA